MLSPIRQLEPFSLWNHFSDLNAVPRPSKKEERIIKFMKDFGEGLKLPTYIDEVGNVIIKKPASQGMEKKPTVVLQGHLDMVHQKNAGTNFDFLTQGIDMYIDGDWVRARGTTLGADNGIGVAAIMTLLSSAEIPHPPLEALFTIDEETGMTGALALKGGLLSGKVMLNLDTEEDNELTIGCAGGVDVTASGPYLQKKGKYKSRYRIHLMGLTGGHSGIDIHKGRANANKLMNRILYGLSKKYPIEIISLDGGSLRNAIPRESVAEIGISKSNLRSFKTQIKEYLNIMKLEYSATDPGLQLSVEAISNSASVVNPKFQQILIGAIYSCPNGIYRMSPDIPGLVQSSNNVARVLVKDGNYSIQCLTRSSVETEKEDLKLAITSTFEFLNSQIQYGGGYPGWIPNPSSPIVQLMKDLYREMYNEDPIVSACHAGLECGIIGTNYPEMQMISFGPTIHGAHSPDEKVNIPSVKKFWGFLLETLKRI